MIIAAVLSVSLSTVKVVPRSQNAIFRCRDISLLCFMRGSFFHSVKKTFFASQSKGDPHKLAIYVILLMHFALDLIDEMSHVRT